jgi:hypothetical protein
MACSREHEREGTHNGDFAGDGDSFDLGVVGALEDDCFLPDFLFAGLEKVRPRSSPAETLGDFGPSSCCGEGGICSPVLSLDLPPEKYSSRRVGQNTSATRR